MLSLENLMLIVDENQKILVRYGGVESPLTAGMLARLKDKKVCKITLTEDAGMRVELEDNQANMSIRDRLTTSFCNC